MNLSVSSIAWTNEEESAVAAKLREMGVRYVELAPTKLWDDPTKATPDEIKSVVEWWKGYDIEIAAVQSMLFTRPDLKLFESEENRQECLSYLKDFIRTAGMMGAKKMVFGSPKNRQKGSLSKEAADEIAIPFFTEIELTAKENNVVFCIEPNATEYNCEYITTEREGIEFVCRIGSVGFGLDLDADCMVLDGDDLGE